MDNRKYNIYFHTHTISGIIICALLYVIFFAGSFSFFKDDIAAWQKNKSYVANRSTVKHDFNHILDSLAQHRKLKGRDLTFTMARHGMSAYVAITPSQDSIITKEAKALAKKKPAKKPERKRRGRGRGGDDDSGFFNYDFAQKKEADYSSGYDMGEFLYRLHFLAQLNVVPIRLGAPFGYLLAGIVSFIFIFALITGLMLHWKKIISNFFTFRPWSKWKTVWTDAHTALGVIGFPFQLLFAITGMVLIVNSFLITPYAKFLYQGDSEKLYQKLEYSDTSKFEYTYRPLPLNTSFDLNTYLAKVEKKWGGSKISLISIKNYQDSNMHLVVQSKSNPDRGFAGSGKIIYRVHDQKVLYEVSPTEHSSYIDKVKALVYHLHFGDFGGRPLRVMFFVLGLMGCVVIISGILIWLVARDKNNVPKHKRVFNFWTANIFLASSLSMLPVTAFTLIVLLFIEKPTQTDIFHWYFYSWLILGIYFIARRDLTLTNRQTVFLSAITCFLVPVFDGFMRDNWIWMTFQKQAFDILFVDLLFLFISIICFTVWFKIRNKQQLQVNS